VGLTLGDARAQRKDWAGAVERLDLGLLVDAQHERLVRRLEVEPDDVSDLVVEVGVLGELEALHEVGL